MYKVKVGCIYVYIEKREDADALASEHEGAEVIEV